MSKKPTPEQLREAADSIFAKYDHDKSGTLEGKQIYEFINDAFKSLGRNKKVSEEEVAQFIKAFDKNKDNKISRDQLVDVLEKLLNS